MALLRLAVCVSGVYAAFLLWAIAQERLSAPFPGISPHTTAKFPSPLFLNWCQALASATCAAAYLILGGARDGSLKRDGVAGVLGLTRLWAALPWSRNSSAANGTLRTETERAPVGLGLGVGVAAHITVNGSAATSVNGDATPTDDEEKQAAAAAVSSRVPGNVNGVAASSARNTRRRTPSSAANSAPPTPTLGPLNGSGVAAPSPKVPWYQTLPALLIQVSIFQTTAGPLGFLALRHISYPTMVLGKSCKLIPVLLLNVLLYRRRFGAHKYVVVALVSAGISMFMLFGHKSGSKTGDSAWGLSLLLFNLLVDGLTNSTQDQIFALYKGYSGQQMMFIMQTLSLSVLTPAMLLPLPVSPLALITSPDLARLHKSFAPPILATSLRFVATHPTSVSPLCAYAALGGLGQLFIFETIAHFGSLTLVMVTVTRKLFTMLLSVFVFGHVLTPGQWAGVAVVFAGIGVEAMFKRRQVRKRTQRDVK